MANVSFLNHNVIIEVYAGTTIAEATRQAGLSLETPCNCTGTCGKCKVKVKGELFPPNPEELAFLQDDANVRLACLAKVKGSVEVELLSSTTNLKTINQGVTINVKVDSPVKKVLLPTQIFGIVYEDDLIDEREHSETILGVAVDIGTTGLSLYLVDLETGEVLQKVSDLNPQTQFGADVLSRITYCMNNSEGLKQLQKTIVERINLLTQKLLAGKFSGDQVYHTIIAGNTTMQHLVAGVDPTSIAQAPYEPVFLDKLDLKPYELDININPNGIVTLLPSASGYVGADILAGVVATGFADKKENSLFVDIGTNGEIVLIADGKMAATSTAAGPALEGMNIACGCRAEPGAIDSFAIDEELNISFTTIGGAKPKGICGSGLIDIVANFVEKEIVLPSGKFNPRLPKELEDRLKEKKFYLTETIYVSQRDIRQVQLAKGAIATGISMLLHELGITADDLEEIVIAGSFGYHVNANSLKGISLIPKQFSREVSFVGNSSVEGAKLALINKEVLARISNLRETMDIVELSLKDNFQEYFVKELRF